MIRRRLRVAVPEAVRHQHPRTGHGRAWRSALAELEQIARVRTAASGARVRADVWLLDGHDEPIETAAPSVALLQEAPWRMPDAMLDPEFMAGMERRSRAVAARASRIITPSCASKRQVAEVLDVPEDRIDVVPHGVDLERFRPSPGAGLERVGGPYVLFVSQLHPRKNLAALREAMRLLAPGHALAIVATAATDRADSTDLAAAAFAPIDGVPVVRVDGPADEELASLMADAAAYCLPSLYEGFGLTALEAMACGAPVIVSDRGALPEVVGDAGIVVEPVPEAIAAALGRVLGDTGLADRLRAAGRERAAGMTWAATARGWLEALERAAEGH